MRNFITPSRSIAVGERGMAATSHPQATLAALDILRSGGNAMDAAIGAVALQGVVEPQMTGIGGDCFVLYSPKGGTPVALNGSGRTPAKTDLAKVMATGMKDIPPTAVEGVTIPGAVDAVADLRDAGHRLRFVTNSTTMSRAQLGERAHHVRARVLRQGARDYLQGHAHGLVGPQLHALERARALRQAHGPGHLHRAAADSAFLYSSGQSSSTMRGFTISRRMRGCVASFSTMTPSSTRQSESSPPGNFSTLA